MIRTAVLSLLSRLGYHLIRTTPPSPKISEHRLPEAEFYQPFFCPWYVDKEFNLAFSLASPATIVTIDRCYILWTLAAQAMNVPGDFWECGVYKGGTARLLAESIVARGSGKHLHLFDTFGGMPVTGAEDLHTEGDFSDTSLVSVRRNVGHPGFVHLYPGKIPEAFDNEDRQRIAFAHIDVDIYQSISDCCHHIYPRLSPGGIMVFDDYGFASCPGARKAVDEFFNDKPERPLVLPTAQAIVMRLAC
jgi:O-methyltransferase